MANYYLQGYSTPPGVESRQAVKEYQRMLGVTADGVWGPVTQAAYERYGGASAPSLFENDAFMDYYKYILGAISTPGVSVSVPGRDALRRDYEASMRPGVDLAIETRRARGERTKAEIDADAASRGMEASTYVTSVKEREGDDVERDVAMMESQYSAALAERISAAMEYYASLEMQAASANAQMRASASGTALSLASQWYQNYLNGLGSGAARSGSYGGGSGGGSGGGGSGGGLSEDDYFDYVFGLTPDQRAGLFYSASGYWKARRDEIVAAIGAERFNTLRNSLSSMPGALGATGGAGGGTWLTSAL